MPPPPSSAPSSPADVDVDAEGAVELRGNRQATDTEVNEYNEYILPASARPASPCPSGSSVKVPVLERQIEDGGFAPVAMSAAEDRRVLRKLDKVLIPLMMCAYTLQYIDRSAMSYAAVFTFRQDLHLSSSDYSWLGSCYFFGYLVFEFPGSWILQRLPISRTMGCMILSWGVLVMCMAAPRSFGGMAAIRTLLGATEALITPGFVLLTSRFYRREEQPLRVGLWYCCNGIGSFLGALVSYGMGHVHVGNIPNWAWIFILNGAITIVFAVLFLWLCPESPESYSRLTAHEKAIALERVRSNKASLHSKTWKWAQFREAVCPWIDPQGWAYFCIVLCITIPNGGIANFLHLILQSYGYTAFQTILMGLPQAAMQIVLPLSAAYIARRWPGLRCYVMMVYLGELGELGDRGGQLGEEAASEIPRRTDRTRSAQNPSPNAQMLPSLLGVLIQYKTRNSGALLFGYYIIAAYVGSLGLCFAAPGANVAGYTKRVTISAMIFIAYATGNIAGPHLFVSTEDPPYRSGMLACIICFTAAIPMMGALRLYYVGENRRRDKVMAEQGEVYDPAKGDFSDRTDLENIGFRYAL